VAKRLSTTARRMLELSASGRSTAEVAACLGIPPEQVRRELVLAMAAFGACSKLELILAAIREGLIDPPRVS
jgi:DNA-binding CsgD family transcriptional regulator